MIKTQYPPPLDTIDPEIKMDPDGVIQYGYFDYLGGPTVIASRLNPDLSKHYGKPYLKPPGWDEMSHDERISF